MLVQRMAAALLDLGVKRVTVSDHMPMIASRIRHTVRIGTIHSWCLEGLLQVRWLRVSKILHQWRLSVPCRLTRRQVVEYKHAGRGDFYFQP